MLASGVAKAPLSISTVALVAVAGGVAMDMVILGAVVVPMDVGSGVAESNVASIVLMMSIAI